MSYILDMIFMEIDDEIIEKVKKNNFYYKLVEIYKKIFIQ